MNNACTYGSVIAYKSCGLLLEIAGYELCKDRYQHAVQHSSDDRGGSLETPVRTYLAAKLAV